MIIDFQAGTGYWPFRKLEFASPPALSGLLASEGIDRAVVYSLTSILAKDCMWGNGELADYACENPGRFIPFACINPAFPGWERDFSTCFDDFGFKGLRLFPSYHGYTLDDDCTSDLIKAARERSLPVAISVRVEDERQHHWLAKVPPLDLKSAVRMIRSFPDTVFVLSCAAYPEICSVKDDLAACDNLYFDTARMQGRHNNSGPVEVIVRLISTFGASRILFGSNAPFQYIQSSLLKVMKAPVSDADRSLILSGNALRILERN